MALVSDSIPYMVQGISQQPDEVRRTFQGAVQINAQSSLVDGLNKRPPTEHIAKILTNSATNVAAHLMDRGSGDRELVIIQSNNTLGGTTLKVFKISDGSETSVSVSGDLSYLVCPDPRNDIVFLTVLDRTYILNKTKTVTMSTVRSANVTFTEVQRFADLSSSAAIGSIHKVVGDEDDKFSAFFVEKTASTSVFVETVAPNTLIRILNTTMPHSLARIAGGTTFQYGPITWSDRTVGDENTNENPGFVDKKISSLFFFKNRFGVTADEKVTLSESGEFENFFRTSVTSPSDADPIDVDVAHTKVSKIEHAVPFNEQLMLFSQQSQFFMESAGALSSDTVSINPASEFEMDVNMPPVGAGVNVYFSQVSGDFSRIRELFVATDLDTHDAADITAHVPKYVPKDVFKATASTSEDIIYFLSSDTPNRLYCYKYNWAGLEKNQSAWSFYEFNSADTILWIETVENKTFFVVSRSDGVFLEESDYLVPSDTNLDFNARLDRKVSLTGSFNASTNTTTWTLPYVVPTATPVVAVKGGTSDDKGTTVTTTRPTTTTVAASGDHSSSSFILGLEYEMRYRFSTQFVREGSGVQTSVGEKMARNEGRLQLRRWQVTYRDTGFFNIEVQPIGRDLKTYEFTTRQVNLTSSAPNRVSLDSGTFRFPIMAKNTDVTVDIKTSSYLPAQFTQAEWEGNYSVHTRRL
tara:strand:+ start:3384 stop:5468 length:2085 start_codon:yes stop_codon:yes gene_type:complete